MRPFSKNLNHKLNSNYVSVANTDLNDYKEVGTYYFGKHVTPINIPVGINGWLEVLGYELDGNIYNVKQIWYRLGTTDTNDFHIYVRTYECTSDAWSEWRRVLTSGDLASVGSIYVMPTNTSPYSKFGIGEWELFDKEFTPIGRTLTQGTDYTINETNCMTKSSVTMLRSGHSMNLRFTIYPNVAIADSTLEMLTLNYKNLGISDTGYTHGNVLGFSDGGQGVVSFSLNYSTGVLQTNDSITKASVTTGVAAGSSIYLDLSFPILGTSDMLDSACSKFYWRRIS